MPAGQARLSEAPLALARCTELSARGLWSLPDGDVRRPRGAEQGSGLMEDTALLGELPGSPAPSRASAPSSALPCSGLQATGGGAVGLRGCQPGGKEVPPGAALAGRWSPASVGGHVSAGPQVRAQVCASELWSRGRREKLMLRTSHLCLRTHCPGRLLAGNVPDTCKQTPSTYRVWAQGMQPDRGVDWWVTPWKAAPCSAPSVWSLPRGSLRHRAARVHVAAFESQLRVSGPLQGPSHPHGLLVRGN